MVDIIYGVSIFLIISVFVILIFFIWKLKFDALIETNNSRHFGKNRMQPLSAKKIPFQNVSLQYDQQKRKEEDEQQEGSLILNVGAAGTFKVVFNCCIAVSEVKRALLSKVQQKRKLLDTINLLSLWSSNSKIITVNEENFICSERLEISNLPTEIYEQFKRDTKRNALQSPVSVYLELQSIHGLQDNDIVSLLIIFSAENGCLLPKDYFLETLSGNVYPLKAVFESGVQDTQHSESDKAILCIVCHTNPVTRTCLPCRHASVCKICYSKLDQHCPVCRQRITSYFPLMDESFLQTEEESRDIVSGEIGAMGWWEFIKAVWNAG